MSAPQGGPKAEALGHSRRGTLVVPTNRLVLRSLHAFTLYSRFPGMSRQHHQRARSRVPAKQDFAPSTSYIDHPGRQPHVGEETVALGAAHRHCLVGVYLGNLGERVGDHWLDSRKLLITS